ncbi:hypothetical protein R3I94_017831 [Phoxinus phoxinus]
MKSALIRVLFFLCAICVFGDAETVETVSVIEGYSVTLHTDVTEIRRDDAIEWRLNDYRIAKISGDSISTDGAYDDRLQLDKQTGDLKITSIKTTDSGEYILKIRNTRGSPEKTFSVSVVSGVDEVKSVSVIVGYSLSLNSGTIIQRDDVIEWRFGDLNSLIAENNRKAGIFSTSDGPDGRFRDRLQLDYSTGSLTITHTSTNHSGLYEADIRKSSSRHTIHKSYNVTAGGDRERKSVSVKKGDSDTLHTGLTEIQTYDFIQWMFEYTLIAEINKAQKQFSTSDGPDERFRGRLKLDHQTGSLTITHTRFTDSGDYDLKIISSRFTINKRFTVTVTDPGLSPGAVAGIAVGGVLLAFAAVAAAVIYQRRKISELKAKAPSTLAVMVGEEVPLIPHGIEIPKDKDIQWRFGGAVIAERKGSAQTITVNYAVLGEKFKGRLQLNKDFGYLTITNITTTDSGYYELCSGRSGMKPLKTFHVSVYAKTEIVKLPVKKGGSVKLETGVTDIKKDDEIQWKFRLYDSPIAHITGGTRTTLPFATGWWRFMCRLKLDQDGSLTISKIELKHTGFYVLYITDNEKTTMKLFNVKVDLTDESWINLIYNRKKPEEKSVRINKPENVPLNSVP